MIKPYFIPEEVTPVSLEQLKSYLWGAAVLLRGQIDATSYKEYIFPLLFFKRLCDVYDEETRDSLRLSEGDVEYANQRDQHRLDIPEDAHWRDVRQQTENIGQALVAALIRIEQANPPIEIGGRMVGGLTGIFGEKRIWTNKDVIPDRLLSDLLEHFSTLTLSLAACPADERGTGYEYLVGRFADDAGHTAQEFYTNRTVVDLMAELLRPEPGESIYDPTCGSGGMLIKCLTSLKDQKREWRGVKIFGQELNALTAMIARMNLFLHDVEDFTIVNEDTLTAPAFIEHGHLKQFDIVLANPPYSIKQWNREAFSNDKYGRNILGTPPQGRADYAFFQHIICSLKPDTGRCAILFPHGVLFRKEEKDMREKLIKSDLVECVIGLGANLFFNSPMEACIIICRAKKHQKQKGKILMINAAKELTRKSAESFLEGKHIKKIADAYHEYLDVDDFSRIVCIDEIAKYNYDLSIQKYIFLQQGESSTMELSLKEYIDEWSRSHNETMKYYGEFCKMLNN